MPALTMGPGRPWRSLGAMLAFSRAWSAAEVMLAVDTPRKGLGVFGTRRAKGRHPG